ncbi:hypothetical protein AALP_AA3G167800 [Arabis alpina]|uniref:Thioredoxin domain-containing protein n=1 Tax=Arabis alpina TaxID=50452 RepID=A0A087H9P4_ARAAL|nr:hypothetical protein AALP_AA3G167800 [Arabis alpina]
MSKSDQKVPEPDKIADKLRDSLSMDDNKPDTVNADLGSPITPLETRPSGLTSTSSCSSSSSGRSGHAPVTTRSDSDRSNSSAAQSSKSTTSSAAGAPLKSTTSSAVQSSKSTVQSGAHSSKTIATSATKSGTTAAQSKTTIHSGGKSSKPTAPSAAQSKPSSSSAAQAGVKTGSSSNSPKTGTGNVRPGRGSATSDSASGAAKPSGKTTTTPPTQPVKIVPAGNLFPSGKVQITGMTQGVPRSMVLGPGPTTAKSYGYGSIMRGNSFSPSKPASSSSVSSASSSSVSSSVYAGSLDAETLWKTVMNSTNPEEVKNIGNEMFKKCCFDEALKLYDRAIELLPGNASYHSNRAAALSGLGRIGEAVIECEEAIRMDPTFARAHHRLATLLLRLGQVDNSGKHFFAVEEPKPDSMVVKMLEQVDKHLNKCTDARRRGDWNIVLSEVSAAMACGADASPQLAMCKVEALLKLLRLDDAQTLLAFIPKVEPFPASFSQTRFFDMNCEAYTCFVKSQMELALGRFENAVTYAEKASEIDPKNSEVETLYRNVRSIVRAHDRGNDLYESERYTEAGSAYGEGLKFDPYNATLFCHRADCFFKVGMWESSIEDCNHALRILPSYIKPLRQRAASYGKLERWAEAVKDYETLRKELPYDKEIAECLFHAQVALKKSYGQVVLNMEFGGEVEEVFSHEELKAALTRPGVSIVLFVRATDQQCKEMSVFMDALCIRYPSLHFLKVEIEKCPAVGDAERVRVVPTFKFYKNGIRVKEIVCPSKEALESSVRHYSL